MATYRIVSKDGSELADRIYVDGGYIDTAGYDSRHAALSMIPESMEDELVVRQAGTRTVEINARDYQDADNMLEAAAEDWAKHHPEATGWDLNARWEDHWREIILLDVPFGR